MKFLLIRINDYLFIEVVFVGVFFFVVIIYFFVKLFILLSLLFVVGCLDFVFGVKIFFNNWFFWLFLVIFSISNGVNWGWFSV